MEKGQIVFASGSCGVVLDVYENPDRQRVYHIYFAKNAVRLQPPEVHLEKNLVGLRLATRAELDDEVHLLKGMISERLVEMRSAITAPIPVEIPIPQSK